jgi:regulator of protease activity HflC (stomatin/prohibitin superfamily)
MLKAMFDRLIDLIVDFIHLFQFWTIVDAYEKGLVLRFGRFSRVLEPGIHLLWPFGIERVLSDNIVPHPMTLAQMSVTSKDGRSVVLTPIVTYRIRGIEKFLLEVEGGDQVVTDFAPGVISNFILNHTWDEIRSPGTPETLRKLVHDGVKQWGITITTLQLRDLTTARSFRLWNENNEHSILSMG